MSRCLPSFLIIPAATIYFICTTLPAFAQQIGGTPVWNSTSNTYQYSNTLTSVGSLPNSSRFAYGVAPNIENVTAAIETPPTSVAVNSTAISGYSRCSGGGNSVRMTNCVGIFGVGLLNANSLGPNAQSGGAWGLNAIAVNAPAVQASANSGYDFGFVGHELDVNVIAKAGGAAPTGSAIGLYINGASAIQPTGNFTGIQITAVGKPWKQGLWIAPQSYDDTGIIISRFRDDNPTSYFIRGTNAANNTSVFYVTDRGDITTLGTISMNSTFTNGNATLRANGDLLTSGAVNAALFASGVNAGVNCAGPPTANFRVSAGIVTRC